MITLAFVEVSFIGVNPLINIPSYRNIINAPSCLLEDLPYSNFNISLLSCQFRLVQAISSITWFQVAITIWAYNCGGITGKGENIFLRFKNKKLANSYPTALQLLLRLRWKMNMIVKYTSITSAVIFLLPSQKIRRMVVRSTSFIRLSAFVHAHQICYVYIHWTYDRTVI